MDASDPPVKGQVGAERKLVTVVVCEVGEPAAAAGQGELEDRDRLLARTLTTVQTEVARHGGLVTEVIGDVVVAVFGVPRTRDDDAERAVLAALAARVQLTSPSLGHRRVRAAVTHGHSAPLACQNPCIPGCAFYAMCSKAVNEPSQPALTLRSLLQKPELQGRRVTTVR